ncbi:uncharacterized protein Z519_03237 [Cladophialophora bantiana CBS 173.52]|uniref:Uncharacterized protein n=1 Tax=Cladophialophora bantiana (strain ATCC 10958 / CBS 173.52 / CDC B-1940 / NIH 8579) TaxID=1442370 RepID=A0A0D2HZ36_CLAB1|nr:uncharacterized protein Z519_03237 [Cladophialophora bantiana CBS 173.52]KIW96170.1 hypothetical protein Z519_03237 [Cladophialophora bantiana CBS 173.52]
MDKQNKTPTTTTVHALSLPYPEPQWPTISPDTEQALLQLLLRLLQPIGEFRRDQVARSKGKGRAGKVNKTQEDSLPEWMPDIYDHLTVGFNSTVRRLESLARGRKPQLLSQHTDADLLGHSRANLFVVFICRQNFPDVMTSSLPLLIATSAPKVARARLVEWSSQAEEKLAQALHQPRVGVLGIEEGAPGTENLLRCVRETVDAVDVPWLDQTSTPIYQSVNIQTVESVPKSNAAVRGRKRKNPGDG